MLFSKFCCNNWSPNGQFRLRFPEEESELDDDQEAGGGNESVGHVVRVDALKDDLDLGSGPVVGLVKRIPLNRELSQSPRTRVFEFVWNQTNVVVQIQWKC